MSSTEVREIAEQKGWTCHGYSVVDESCEQPVSARQEGWHAVHVMAPLRPRCSECPGVEHCADPHRLTVPLGKHWR